MSQQDQMNPEVVLPEHIQKGIDAPPTYEEVMGGQAMTTVQKEETSLPPLSYIDILPRCVHPGNMEKKITPQFEPFASVIEAANAWLRANSSYTAWKCETFEKPLQNDLTVDLTSMLDIESSNKFKVYLTGIRLFLTTQPHAPTNPQQLGLLNVLPESESIGAVKQRYRSKAPQLLAAGNNSLNFPPGCQHTFVGLGETLEKLNEKLKNNPINGSIINVQTCIVKMAETFGASELDPDKTFRTEGGGSFARRYVHVIRVFYVLGNPAKEEVGTEVFAPDILSYPEGAKSGKYEGFNGILYKLAMWLKNQSVEEAGYSGSTKFLLLHKKYGYRASFFRAVVIIIVFNPIPNVWSRRHPLFSEPYDDTLLALLTLEYWGFQGGFSFIDADSTDDFDGKIERRVVQVMRVFYVKAPSMPSYANANLSSRLFIPVRLANREFETMTQTMYRIEAWLRITKLRIFGVESVTYLADLSTGRFVCGFDPDKTDFTLRVHQTKNWVTAIRLYFPNGFQEPFVPLPTTASNTAPPPGGQMQNVSAQPSSKSSNNKSSSSCLLL